MVALPPTGGNWNIYGLEETVTSGSGSTLSILSPRVATFIVDPVANRGTHTTIATAIADASSGDSICIRPGTYTEDLTIKTGLTIWGNPGGGLNSTFIDGTLTFTGAVTSSFSDINFTSNAGPIIVIDGAGTNQSRFYSCGFDSTTHDLMTINNASGNPFFTECFFGLATNTKLFTITLAGQPQFAYCKFNSYGTLVVSNIAAGRVYFRFCDLGQLKLSTSGAAGANTFISYCLWDPSANHTFLSTTGSGRSEIIHSYFNSGTSSAFNIGAGTQADFSAVSIISSNPSPIAGAGTITFPSTLYGV
jgi:hypothetical protein